MEIDENGPVFKELMEEALPLWIRLAPEQRAEIFIRQFNKLENPTPEQQAFYDSWLLANEKLLTETGILRKIFEEKWANHEMKPHALANAERVWGDFKKRMKSRGFPTGEDDSTPN